MEFVSDTTKKTPVTPQEVMAVTNEALKRGLIIIRSGLFSNCIRLLPPLILTDEQIDEGMKIFAEAVRVGMPKREVVIGD
jgi:4-aminobutyrate aminotransferase / (S)-3-amino-2-methylpropionate transaminase / 5-aminovalerate transaminase